MSTKFVFALALAFALGGSARSQTASTTPEQTVPAEATQAQPAAPVSPATHKEAVDPGPATLSTDQIKELIRKIADNDIQNDLKQRDYTYTLRSETRFLDGHGELKKAESETVEMMVLYGEQLGRKIAKNDEPLSDKDAAKEEKKLQELIDKRKNESEDDRQKRLAKQAKEREEARQFVKEIADAYNFSYRGTQVVDGRNAYVIDFEPRSDYKPRLKDAKYLKKFRGRVWIDPVEYQLVKMEAEAIDTVSWGLFLARISKGALVFLEQTRVNDEVWLPKRVQVKFDGRLALLKSLHREIYVSFKDYKKFRTNSRVVSLAPSTTEPQPTTEPQ